MRGLVIALAALATVACEPAPAPPLPPLAGRCLEVRPASPGLAAEWGTPAFVYLDTVADLGRRGAYVVRPAARDAGDAARLREVYGAMSGWTRAGEGDSLRLGLGTGHGGLSFALGASRGDTLVGSVSSARDYGPTATHEGAARAWLVPCAGLTFR
jgi:hypothetical protein